MHHADADGRGDLDAEIAVGDAVQAVGAGAVKAEHLRRELPVDRVGGPGQRAGAERAVVQHAGEGVLQAAIVAQQHPGVGHQLVAHRHGLGALQVGVAGHDAAGVLFGLIAQDRHQAEDLVHQAGDFLPQGQADVQRDLVVAAAAGVQALARVADAGGQRLLDKGMDVFGRRVDLQRAAFQVGQNLLQAGQDGVAVLRRNDALLAEHRRMGHAAVDVLAGHALVKANAGVEIVDAGVHRFAETAFPKLFCHEKRSLPHVWLGPARKNPRRCAAPFGCSGTP